MILCIIIALLVGILEAALFVLPTACLGAAPILTDTNDEKPTARAQRAFPIGVERREVEKRIYGKVYGSRLPYPFC